MKKLAFVDLTNFSSWPMGGMLEYERAILPYLARNYDLELWGVNIDYEDIPKIELNGKLYRVNVFAHCKRKFKVIPNFWKGLSLFMYRKRFYNTYDIIYVHTASCAVALFHIINTKRTKIVYHHHCFSYLNDERIFALVQKPFYRIALRKSNVNFIVADKESVDDYSSNCGFSHQGTFLPIGSPVSLENFNKEIVIQRIIKSCNREKTLNFVYAGRIDSWKNVGLLVRAFYFFLQKKQNSKLTIIGSGPEERNIKELIEKLCIGNYVEMLGSLPHTLVCRHLEESDIFLISSKGEGWSVAVLEAFAAGLPVVCGNVQGLRSEVKDGETGAISKEYSEQGFYEAMKRAYENMEVLSLNALKEAEKYKVSTIANQIVEVLEEV